MPAKPSIEAQGCAVLLRVRVQPRASRNAIHVEQDGRIRVALTAPPVEGQANRALCDFIAKAMGVRRGNVKVKGGERSREKTLAVEGVSLRSVRAKLLPESPDEDGCADEDGRADGEAKG